MTVSPTPCTSARWWRGFLPHSAGRARLQYGSLQISDKLMIDWLWSTLGNTASSNSGLWGLGISAWRAARWARQDRRRLLWREPPRFPHRSWPSSCLREQSGSGESRTDASVARGPTTERAQVKRSADLPLASIACSQRPPWPPSHHRQHGALTQETGAERHHEVVAGIGTALSGTVK